MSPWLSALIGLVSITPFYLISVACWNLRFFSRSKLDQLCRKSNRQQRFEAILLHHELVLQKLEYVQVMFLIVGWLGLSWSVGQILQPTPQPDSSMQHWLSWAAGFDAAIIALLVFSAAWVHSEIFRERNLLQSWPALLGLATLGWPFVAAATLVTTLTRTMTGETEEIVDEAESIADELRSVTEEGHREGVIEDEARTMIHRVIDFSEVDVADIMTPRTEMVCVSAEADLLDARQVLLQEGHSRVPVIGKTNDEILGILHAKDLLRYLDGSMGNAVSLADIAREPFYVPKTMGVQNLLEAFKRERTHLAIVLDEYGGVAGLVTMEDVLEELVGEIVDEFDAADEGVPYRTVVEGTYDVSAKAHVDDIHQHLGIELPSDGQVDTLGGYVFASLGRIPVTGEQFRIGNVEFTVLEAHKRRIARVRLKPIREEATESE